MFTKKKKSRKDVAATATDSVLDVLSDEIVIMFGELRKKGKVNTSWKNRWCELSFLEDGLILSYYLSKLNKKLCGTIKTTDIFALRVLNYDEKEFTDYNLPADVENDGTPDLSDLKYSFSLCTLARDFVLAAPNKTDFLGWIEIFNKYIYGHIIYEGKLLLKKEKTTNTWAERYFILNQYKQFKYYQDKDKKTFCGAISLSEVNEIKNGKVYDDAHKFTFNLYSKKNKRKWVLCCRTMKQRETWQQTIKQIRANEEVRVIGQNDRISDDDVFSERDMFSDVEAVSDSEINFILDTHCQSLATCKALNNLSSALHFFSTIIDKSLSDANTMDLLLTYFEHDKNGKNILNDYAHLLHLHVVTAEHHSMHNINVFESIYTAINNVFSCDLNKCKQYLRNTRNREKERINDDVKMSYYIDLMDTVHCYFLHSFDMGYKVSIRLDSDTDTDTKKDDIDCYKEYYQSITAIRQQNKLQSTKRFTTFIPETMATQNVLSVGQRFNYWDDEDEYFVAPYFATLKKEIIGKISIGGYNLSLFKAQQYLLCIWMKRIKITLQQILAVMIYTDYDIFAENMQKTFIRTAPIKDASAGRKLKESNRSLIKRNAKYAHLAKFLSEVIDGFGDNPMDKEKHNILSFYTSPNVDGIANISTIDLSKIRLFGIHSTTASIEVIMSNNNGIIMELNNTLSSNDTETDSQWPSWQNTTYFQCNFFSSKGYESEVIFTNTYNPLSISLMNVLDNSQQWIACNLFINAFAIFTEMIHGIGMEGFKKYRKKDFEMILRLLRNDDKLPELINDAFEQWQENVTELTIDLSIFKNLSQKSKKKQIAHYFITDGSVEMLKYKELTDLFPNLQAIHTKCSENKKAQTINVSETFFEELLVDMDDLNKTEAFKQIVIVNADINCDLNKFNAQLMGKNWNTVVHLTENNGNLSISRRFSDDEEDEDVYNMDVHVPDDGGGGAKPYDYDEDGNGNYNDNITVFEDDEDEKDRDEERERLEIEQKQREMEEEKRRKREERRKERQLKRQKSKHKEVNDGHDDKKEEIEEMRDRIEQKLKNKENALLRKGKEEHEDHNERSRGKKRRKPKKKSKKKRNYSNSDSVSDDGSEQSVSDKKKKPKRKKHSMSNSDHEKSGSDNEEKARHKYKRKKSKKKHKKRRKSKRHNVCNVHEDEYDDGIDEQPNIKATQIKKGNGKVVKIKNKPKRSKAKKKIKFDTDDYEDEYLDDEEIEYEDDNDNEDKRSRSKKKQKPKLKRSKSRKAHREKADVVDDDDIDVDIDIDIDSAVKPKIKRSKSKRKKKRPKRTKSKKRIKMEEDEENSTDGDGF